MNDLNGRLARLEAQFGLPYNVRPSCRIDTTWDGERPLLPGEFTLSIFRPYTDVDFSEDVGGAR